MNVDILKRSNQLILVCVDLFSSYVTACFIKSEKSEDLTDGIIQTVTPIRSSGNITVRVDKAPGLLKIINDCALEDLGITLIPGDDENKNSNCSVDKIIDEMEQELRKLSPAGDKVNSTQLARCIISLNGKIRNRNLTASEIHFARDMYDQTNLLLDDNSLQADQHCKRTRNHPILAKSRAPRGKQMSVPEIKNGDIVYIKKGMSKHVSRDPHIVVGKDDLSKVIVRKALHTFPQDQVDTRLSHKTKTIDRKFLFTPSCKSKPLGNQQNDDAMIAYSPPKRSVQMPSFASTWNPLSTIDDPESLIPLHATPE